MKNNLTNEGKITDFVYSKYEDTMLLNNIF